MLLEQLKTLSLRTKSLVIWCTMAAGSAHLFKYIRLICLFHLNMLVRCSYSSMRMLGILGL